MSNNIIEEKVKISLDDCLLFAYFTYEENGYKILLKIDPKNKKISEEFEEIRLKKMALSDLLVEKYCKGINAFEIIVNIRKQEMVVKYYEIFK